MSASRQTRSASTWSSIWPRTSIDASPSVNAWNASARTCTAGPIGSDPLDARLHATEGFVRDLTEPGPELQVGDDAEEHQAVQGRMPEHSPSETLETDFYEIIGGVVGHWHGVDGLVEGFEEAGRQRFEEALLRSEEAVDGTRRDARFVGDGSHRRRVGATGVDEALGPVQQCCPARLVVLSRSSHGLTAYRNSVTVQRIVTTSRKEEGPMSEDKNLTLVLGSTGKTGRRVAERLTARGVPVRLGSRSGTPPFDWEEETTWAPALEGIDQVYVSYYPDLAVPGAVEVVGSFARLAVKNGVPRLVLLAGRGEAETEHAEQAVRDSGADLTIVRSTWFMQNFSEDYMIEHVLSGEIALPAGDTPEPFVDADDIADVAVAALTDDRHVGQLYELTGPRLLTFSDAADELSKATGHNIRYVPVSLEEPRPLPRSRASPRCDRPAHLSVQRGPGRSQRSCGGRRAACPGSGAARLPRLRA